MGAAEVIIWVTVISVFVILFGTIIYLFSRSPPTSPPDETESTNPKISPPVEPPDPVSFLYSCKSDLDCQENLTCDTFWSQCKIANGQMCRSNFDCLTSSFCSGVCLDRSVIPNAVSGEANDVCPCQLGFDCVNSATVSNKKVCLKYEGVECSQNDECISGKCNTLFEIPICSGPRFNGDSCQTSTQCGSGNCSKGYCQDPGITTGGLNSKCKANTSPTCNTGLVCSVANTCVEATNGLLYPCNEVVGCPSYFNCYYIPDVDSKGKYKAPNTPGGFKLCQASDTTGCACLFSTDVNTALPTPNKQSVTHACVPWQVPVTESGNNICKSTINNPCSGTLSTNGGCVNGITCNRTPGLYRIKTTFSGADNCYPLPGAVGATDVIYDKISLPSATFFEKIIGTTVGFSVPRDIDGNISIDNCSDINQGVDKLYILTTSGKAPTRTIPDTETVLWSWSSSSPQAGWSPVLTYKFTDRNGIEYHFVNAAVTTVLANGENVERLIVAGLILTGVDTNKMALLSYNFDNRTIFPYITANGVPLGDGGAPVDFDDLSITEAQRPTNVFASILLIDTVLTKVYYNYSDSTFAGRSGRIPQPDKSPTNFQLNYGLTQNPTTGAFTSFPIMTCITGDNGSRYIRFSESLDANNTNTYVGVKYPTPMYGGSFSSVYVNNYSFAQINPLKYGFQNGIFSSFDDSNSVPTIYTFSTGSLSAIPGYVTNAAKFLATTANAYVFSFYNCA